MLTLLGTTLLAAGASASGSGIQSASVDLMLTVDLLPLDALALEARDVGDGITEIVAESFTTGEPSAAREREIVYMRDGQTVRIAAVDGALYLMRDDGALYALRSPPAPSTALAVDDKRRPPSRKHPRPRRRR